MKRLWFAVLFLAIAIGICGYEQHTIVKTFDTMSSILDSINDDISAENYNNIVEKSNELNEYWEKQYPILSATNDHSSLDETTVSIDSLEVLASNESDDLPSAVREAKRRLKTLYNSSRPTFGNIF